VIKNKQKQKINGLIMILLEHTSLIESKTELVLPGYYKAGLIEHYELNKWSDEQFITNYLIVNTDLKFNTNVKYTSI
jgi:hypothetical protein